MTDVTGLVAALADLPNIHPTEGRAMRRPGGAGVIQQDAFGRSRTTVATEAEGG